MNLKKIGYILLFLILLKIGCVSDFKAVLPLSMDDILVVEGDIVENTDAIFYLSKTFSLSDPQRPDAIVTANVKVIGSDGYQSTPAVSLGDGNYRIAIGELDENVSYSLQVEYDGYTYHSTLAKPLRTPEIDNISWHQEGGRTGTVHFKVSTHDNDHESSYYRWFYDETWEISVAIETSSFFDPKTSTYYEDETMPYRYCWMYNTGGGILVGSTESLVENRVVNLPLYEQPSSGTRFSVLYSVNVTQQAIAKDAYEHYLSKKSMNENMGGLFTPQPSELIGNIVCTNDPNKRVIGYVNVVKNTTQKRIFIRNNELAISDYACETVLADADVRYYLDSLQVSIADFYAMRYRPAGLPKDATLQYGTWALGTCTDCVMRGGVKLKPDYWPNDHE